MVRRSLVTSRPTYRINFIYAYCSNFTNCKSSLVSLQIFMSCVQIFTRISLRANVLRTCTFNCTVTEYAAQSQTTEQRLLSLQRRRDRLIGESTQQREARLQDLSVRQRQTLATGSAGQASGSERTSA